MKSNPSTYFSIEIKKSNIAWYIKREKIEEESND
jgi:hypothetical protein